MIDYCKATLPDLEAVLKARMDFLTSVNAIRDEQEAVWMCQCNRDFFIEALEDDQYYHLLALEDDKIIAMGSISFDKYPPHPGRPNAKVGYIANMFTYPEYRGKGIASRILELLTQEAKSRECRQVFLNATPMGKPVYEKFGFHDTDDQMIITTF